jgi:hypothetical protein
MTGADIFDLNERHFRDGCARLRDGIQLLSPQQLRLFQRPPVLNAGRDLRSQLSSE